MFPKKLKLIKETDTNSDVLRTVSAEVTSFGNDLNDFCRNMLRVMRAGRGIGLAAPQVGVNLRIVVIGYNNRDEVVMINPVIISKSNYKDCVEGCLSIPGKRYNRNRAQQVLVSYKTPRGGEKTREFHGVYAQCIQHEIEHLDGILLSDEPDTHITD